jgi:UDP-glucose 4-epimerase
VGSGRTTTINKVANLISKNRIYIPKRPGEPDITHANISRIRNKLGWFPKVSIEEGVKIILLEINYWIKAPVWTPGKIKNATKDWFKFLK